MATMQRSSVCGTCGGDERILCSRCQGRRGATKHRLYHDPATRFEDYARVVLRPADPPRRRVTFRGELAAAIFLLLNAVGWSVVAAVYGTALVRAIGGR